MGFRRGAYAKIWEVEDKGKYSVCRMSISQKNKETDEYETIFNANFVRLVGLANDIIKREIDDGETKVEFDGGLSVEILDCDVTNNYVKEKKTEYTNYVVFDMIVRNNNSSNSSKSKTKTKSESKSTSKKAKAKPEPEEDILSDDDLPF